ncbi:MAG TPA: response regulator [Xanthobacteraceae bacterium]|nr:response regulator [Xanthobacteraceae bacterium]
MRILVIDDDDGLRKSMGMVLHSLGHECVLAANVIEGLARAEEQHFDVAMTDMNMPGLDGLEAVKALRNIRPPIAIVAMSGGSTQSSAEDYGVLALNMGAGVFLPKPFKRADVAQAIETAIAKKA